MKNMNRLFITTGIISALTACGGGSGGSNTSAPNTKGQLTLSLTDAPVDSLQSVVITVTGVSLKPQNGEEKTVTFTEAKKIDMLDLQNGVVASLLDKYSLEAGAYEWVRLELSTADNALYVEDNLGGMVGLKIPSGFQSGLKLNSGFTIPQGGDANFTIDFDLRKSVVKPTGQADYFLKPSLRLIDNTTTGTLSGNISSGLLQTACANTSVFSGLVYVFSGTNIVPDDYDGLAVEALTAAAVTYNGTTGNYSYKMPFLASGDYTIAFSCNLDDQAKDEILSFTQIQNVAIVSKITTTINFQ